MFVVCRNKDDNSLFITTRKARETMVNVLLDLGQIPESMVIKQCDTHAEADIFLREQERVDKELNNLLNQKP